MRTMGEVCSEETAAEIDGPAESLYAENEPIANMSPRRGIFEQTHRRDGTPRCLVQFEGVVADITALDKKKELNCA